MYTFPYFNNQSWYLLINESNVAREGSSVSMVSSITATDSFVSSKLIVSFALDSSKLITSTGASFITVALSSIITLSSWLAFFLGASVNKALKSSSVATFSSRATSLTTLSFEPSSDLLSFVSLILVILFTTSLFFSVSFGVFCTEQVFLFGPGFLLRVFLSESSTFRVLLVDLRPLLSSIFSFSPIVLPDELPSLLDSFCSF